MNDIHSLIGPYVADALDPTERDDFERHLSTCRPCRDEVLALREAMAEVGAHHEVAPPPALRASVLSAISTTPMLPATDPAPEPAPRREPPATVITPAHGFGRPRRPLATWLAAAAAVLAVALGGVTVWQQSQLQSIQSADAQRSHLLSAPDLQVAPASLDGGQLTYFVSLERGEALLASSNLPDPGEKRSWQVWVMHDDVPRSGAVVDEGGQVQQWISDVTGGQALAITNEPLGGSPQPTTEDIQAYVEL